MPEANNKDDKQANSNQGNFNFEGIDPDSLSYEQLQAWHDQKQQEEAAAQQQANNGNPRNQEEKGATKGESKSQPTIALDLFETDSKEISSAQYSTLYKDGKILYAKVDLDGKIANLKLDSEDFESYIQYLFNANTGKLLPPDAMKTVIGGIKAQAKFFGTEAKLHNRVALSGDSLFVDLADGEGAVIEINRSGWSIFPNQLDLPVNFENHNLQNPLPIPVRIAKDDYEPLDRFRKLLGMDGKQNEGTWILILCFILFGYWPEGAHPTLGLHGNPGAGKTTTTNAIISMIDPSEMGSLGPEFPSDRDLNIHCLYTQVLSFDNLSGITKKQSDKLCRISTGAAATTRTLFKNKDLENFKFIRPIILNGIQEVVFEGDLLRRSIIVNLPDRDKRSKLSERAFWKQYNDMQPEVLGCLFNLISQVIPVLEKENLNEDSGLEDFAIFGDAVIQALGYGSGRFMQAYKESQQHGHETIVENNPVSQALYEHMKFKSKLECTASELLDDLNKTDTGKRNKNKGGFWPVDTIRLSRALKRVEFSLKKLGINVEFIPNKHERLIKITNSNPEIEKDEPVKSNPKSRKKSSPSKV